MIGLSHGTVLCKTIGHFFNNGRWFTPPPQQMLHSFSWYVFQSISRPITENLLLRLLIFHLGTDWCIAAKDLLSQFWRRRHEKEHLPFFDPLKCSFLGLTQEHAFPQQYGDLCSLPQVLELLICWGWQESQLERRSCSLIPRSSRRMMNFPGVASTWLCLKPKNRTENRKLRWESALRSLLCVCVCVCPCLIILLRIIKICQSVRLSKGKCPAWVRPKEHQKVLRNTCKRMSADIHWPWQSWHGPGWRRMDKELMFLNSGCLQNKSRKCFCN